MLKLFTITGFIEGITYLVLFFNMLVTKNANPELYHQMLFPFGITHGALFIAYVVLAVTLKVKLQWSFKKFVLIFIASLIPFGTFYSEKNWVHREF